MEKTTLMIMQLEEGDPGVALWSQTSWFQHPIMVLRGQKLVAEVDETGVATITIEGVNGSNEHE